MQIESIPSAGLLLQSLRSVGYTEETAIADILDNSISAQAKTIKIKFDWDKQTISIVDDGFGMEEKELYENMKIGSADPNQTRSEDDLGRFGMGMKTAAFSLGRKVTVVTAKDGTVSNASWDLDKVDELGWNLIVDEKGQYDSYISEFSNHGTAVIISYLDNIAINKNNPEKAKKDFFKAIRNVENHLGLVFHRFIQEDGLKIFINETLVKAWNPFVTDNPATQELAIDELWDPYHTYIQPYVLPHKTKFKSPEEYDRAAGFKKWSRHQGIYLYRNRRLIIYGDWFDIVRKEPAYNLARIRIDISSDADVDWKIDIKKSHATIPSYLRDRVERAVQDCVQRSTKVFNSRGAYTSAPSSPTLDYVWEQTKINGNYMFRINKKHPLLRRLQSQLNQEGNKELKTYLALIENFAPHMKSGLADTMSSAKKKLDSAQEPKNLADLDTFVKVFKEQGFMVDESIETVKMMPQFYDIPDLEKRVGEIYDK